MPFVSSTQSFEEQAAKINASIESSIEKQQQMLKRVEASQQVQAHARAKAARKEAQRRRDARAKEQAAMDEETAKKLKKLQEEQAAEALAAVREREAAEAEAARKAAEDEEAMRASMRIQAVQRGKAAREQVAVLQREAEEAEEEARLLKQRSYATTQIQKMTRGSLARRASAPLFDARAQERELQRRRERAASKLQARHRGSKSRWEFEAHMDELRAERERTRRKVIERQATRIQAVARGNDGRAIAGAKARIRTEQRSAVKLQAASRGKAGRSVAQAERDRQHAWLQARRERKASLRIQKMGRGYLGRSEAKRIKDKLESDAAEWAALREQMEKRVLDSMRQALGNADASEIDERFLSAALDSAVSATAAMWRLSRSPEMARARARRGDGVRAGKDAPPARSPASHAIRGFDPKGERGLLYALPAPPRTPDVPEPHLRAVNAKFERPPLPPLVIDHSGRPPLDMMTLNQQTAAAATAAKDAADDAIAQVLRGPVSRSPSPVFGSPGAYSPHGKSQLSRQLSRSVSGVEGTGVTRLRQLPPPPKGHMLDAAAALNQSPRHNRKSPPRRDGSPEPPAAVAASVKTAAKTAGTSLPPIPAATAYQPPSPQPQAAPGGGRQLPSPGELADALADRTRQMVDLLYAWDEERTSFVSRRDFCQAVLPLLQQAALEDADVARWATDRHGKMLSAAQLRPALEALFAALDAQGGASAGRGQIRYDNLNKLLRKVPRTVSPPPPVSEQRADSRERDPVRLPRAANVGGKWAGGADAAGRRTDAGPVPQARPAVSAAMVERLREALTANAARVTDLFREWDDDGDGAVDKREFRAVLPLLGEALERDAFGGGPGGGGAMPTVREVDALFDSFDADGSGSIDYRELHRLLRRAIELDPKLHPGAAGDIAVHAENNERLRTRPLTPPHQAELRKGGAIAQEVNIGRLRSQLRGHDNGLGAQLLPKEDRRARRAMGRDGAPRGRRRGGPGPGPARAEALERSAGVYKAEVVEGRYKPPAVSMAHLRSQQASLAAARAHRRACGEMSGGGSASAPTLGYGPPGASEWGPDPRTNPMSRFYFAMNPMGGGLSSGISESLLTPALDGRRQGGGGGGGASGAKSKSVPPARKGGPSPPRVARDGKVRTPRDPRRSSPPRAALPPPPSQGWTSLTGE